MPFLKKAKFKKYPWYYLFSLLIFPLLILIYLLTLKPYYFSFQEEIQTPASLIEEFLLESQLAKLPLEEKVSALFIVPYNQSLLANVLEANILENNPNFRHFILFDDVNVNTGYLHLPTIICIDQEGGLVSRIKSGKMDQTSQAEIKDPVQAYEVAKSRAKILKEYGINTNLAPVVEVIRDKDSYLALDNRAFLGNEEQVVSLAQAMIKGYQEEGIRAVLKHFPGGLGRKKADPHQTLPLLNISKAELDQDLIPFKKLIKTKLAKAVMTTHIFYPQIDPHEPVTTSKIFIEDILRKELGFKGIIITDDLIMRGISSQKTVEEAALQAFLAGHDLLLISGPREIQKRAYKAVLEAVKNGKISQKRLNLSLKRIIKLFQ